MAGEVVVDALPYIDQGYDEPGVRESALAMVEEETRRYRPTKSYLDYLPVLNLNTFTTDIMQSEFERLQSRIPLEMLSMKRYELPQPLAGKMTDIAAWTECVDNSMAQLEHQATRINNLDLMACYGCEAWKVYNGIIHQMVQQAQAKLQEMKKNIQDINWNRKNDQGEAGKKLQNLEESWVGLVSKNYEIERACVELESELNVHEKEKYEICGMSAVTLANGNVMERRHWLSVLTSIQHVLFTATPFKTREVWNYLSLMLINNLNNNDFNTARLAAVKSEKSLKRRDILHIRITRNCDDIKQIILGTASPLVAGHPKPKFSLRMSAQLMFGLIKIYKRQLFFIYDDICHLISRLSAQKFLQVAANIDLNIEAKGDTVTLKNPLEHPDELNPEFGQMGQDTSSVMLGYSQSHYFNVPSNPELDLTSETQEATTVAPEKDSLVAPEWEITIREDDNPVDAHFIRDINEAIPADVPLRDEYLNVNQLFPEPADSTLFSCTRFLK
ncbi:Pre-mRNA-splicing factor SPF27 [Nymphon striatum]|nr:Pre-mRNA-splicing factor SPF27 [Nymphon striatum]